jgi:hypothetical protein
VDLSLRRLFEDPTVANLARAIQESQGERKDGPIGKVNAGNVNRVLSRLDQLSDEEIESLFRQELEEEEIN